MIYYLPLMFYGNAGLIGILCCLTWYLSKLVRRLGTMIELAAD